MQSVLNGKDKPVPKCFPMKNIIRGMRRHAIRFERAGNETADMRTSVACATVTAIIRDLTQEGNHENEKRGDYACVEWFGFWLHQGLQETGAICIIRSGVILIRSRASASETYIPSVAMIGTSDNLLAVPGNLLVVRKALNQDYCPRYALAGEANWEAVYFKGPRSEYRTSYFM